jgi:hypothetical protein
MRTRAGGRGVKSARLRLAPRSLKSPCLERKPAILAPADGVSGCDEAYAVLRSMIPLSTFKAALMKSRDGSRKPSRMCRGESQHPEVLQLINLKRILADVQSPYFRHAIGVMCITAKSCNCDKGSTAPYIQNTGRCIRCDNVPPVREPNRTPAAHSGEQDMSQVLEAV